MKIAVFSTKPFDRKYLEAANASGAHELDFFETDLNHKTHVLTAGFSAVSVRPPSHLDAPTIQMLAHHGVHLIALRSAGFDYVDLAAAREHGIKVVRVPDIAPYAIAEFTVAMILSLSREIHRAHYRIRDGNFALDGLLGFDLYGRTVGIIGTGSIGMHVARIMRGFGCSLLAYSRTRRPECEALGACYVDLPELYAKSDIITLHCPLTPETHHLLDANAFAQMKQGVMLINTGRGGLIDTRAAIHALKTGKIGYLGLDVYEREAGLFYEDLSDHLLKDDTMGRLLTLNNVIVTSHMAWFTENHIRHIAQTTLDNISDFEQGRPCANEVHAEHIAEAETESSRPSNG